ncbi:MICOS complex subunit MIC60 [Yarrowia sp. B02]|nr:MICOS complex subunit MIC60 [Yarrowia sp. B02]
MYRNATRTTVRIARASHARNASSQTQNPPGKLRKLFRIGVAAGLVGYSASVFFASRDERFRDIFIDKFPFGRPIGEYFEELEIKKNRDQPKPKPLPQSKPRTSHLSALYPDKSNPDALTNNPDGDSHQERKFNLERALSSKGSKKEYFDPLTENQGNFFDPSSGVVAEEHKEYLPLILLHDSADHAARHSAMALNDLISSINTSIVTNESVKNVSDSLVQLSAFVAENHPEIQTQLSERLGEKAKRFHALGEHYHTIIQDFLQNEVEHGPHQGHAAEVELTIYETDKMRDLRKNVIQEIHDTEDLLVKYCNRYSRPEGPVAEVITRRVPTVETVTLEPIDQAGFDASKYKKQISAAEQSLAVLVAAVQHSSVLGVDPFVEGVRQALNSVDGGDRAKILTEALKNVTIPSDVNLAPYLEKIADKN